MRFSTFSMLLYSLSLERYASEVDVDFVRKSIKAIGQCAIKLESSAERCVGVLVDLINTKVSYVVQEAVVVMKVRDHFLYSWTLSNSA